MKKELGNERVRKLAKNLAEHHLLENWSVGFCSEQSCFTTFRQFYLKAFGSFVNCLNVVWFLCVYSMKFILQQIADDVLCKLQHLVLNKEIVWTVNLLISFAHPCRFVARYGSSLMHLFKLIRGMCFADSDLSLFFAPRRRGGSSREQRVCTVKSVHLRDVEKCLL